MGCAAGWATHSHCYADKGSVCFVVWDKQIYRRVHAMKPASVKGFGGLKTTAHNYVVLSDGERCSWKNRILKK